MHEAKIEDFDRIIGANLRGVFLCVKHQTGAMQKAGNGGRIWGSALPLHLADR